jgi:putative FmdB family regulatory protein
MPPLYSYSCKKCGRITDGMRTVAERTEAPECYLCGSVTELVISPVKGIVKSPATPPGNWRKP